MLSSNLSPKIVAGRRCSCPDSYFHSAYRFGTRILAHVYGLLGPCFKTGRMTPCEPTYGGDPTHPTSNRRGTTSMLEARSEAARRRGERSRPAQRWARGHRWRVESRRTRHCRVATSRPSMSALSGGFRPGRPTAPPHPHTRGAQARGPPGPDQSFRNRAGFIRLRYSDLRHV